MSHNTTGMSAGAGDGCRYPHILNPDFAALSVTRADESCTVDGTTHRSRHVQVLERGATPDTNERSHILSAFAVEIHIQRVAVTVKGTVIALFAIDRLADAQVSAQDGIHPVASGSIIHHFDEYIPVVFIVDDEVSHVAIVVCAIGTSVVAPVIESHRGSLVCTHEGAAVAHVAGQRFGVEHTARKVDGRSCHRNTHKTSIVVRPVALQLAVERTILEVDSGAQLHHADEATAAGITIHLAGKGGYDVTIFNRHSAGVIVHHANQTTHEFGC